jgi:hypothetical protein
MEEGAGEIQIELSADLPGTSDPNRKLVFENHHQNRISAYLVNCLVPQDRRLRIVSQARNLNQSVYELNYVQERAVLGPRNVENSWEAHRKSDKFAFLALIGLAAVCGKQFIGAFQ